MLSAQNPVLSFSSKLESGPNAHQASNETRRPLVIEKPFGRRLAVNIIDERSRTEPERPCLFVPRSSEPKDGWDKITYRQISNAINFVAGDITRRYGQPSRNAFPTIAYIGPNDVRYLIMMLACVKSSYKVFFISPRNSFEGYISLLEATQCNAVFYAEANGKLVETCLTKRPIETVVVPSAAEWLSSETPPFPYCKTFDEARWDPMCVLHTSGSTGIPKPIVVRQGSFALADALRHLPPVRGAKFSTRMSERSQRLFLPMPMFHAAAIYACTNMAIFYGQPVALAIPDRPLNSELVRECLENSGVESAMLPPSILEELSQSAKGVEALKKLKLVSFGGGSHPFAEQHGLVYERINYNL